jgi:anti-sigma B factor antagonist
VTETSTPQPVNLAVEEPASGTTVLRVSGELDMLTSSDLRRAIARQLDRRPRRLVIDLNDVEFMGTSGLAALVEARTEALAGKVGLTLACRTRQVRRPLEIAGLVDLFHIVDSAAAHTGLDSPDQAP